MQRIIVDAYNVMHADPALRRQLATDSEGARRAFLERLGRYVHRKQVRMTVVFDGRGGLADASAVVPGRLQVVFTAAGQTADQFIVAVVSSEDSARAYIVVTSDMADIGRHLRGLGAQIMPSPEFLARLARGGPEDSSTGDDEASTSSPEGDLDYWMEQFGVDRPSSDGE